MRLHLSLFLTLSVFLFVCVLFTSDFLIYSVARSDMTTYCMMKTKSVEIVRQGRLEKVFFPITEGGLVFFPITENAGSFMKQAVGGIGIKEDLKKKAFDKLTHENILGETAEMTVQAMMGVYKEVNL